MKLTIVVDNWCVRHGLRSEWGYAALLESAQGTLLWDTAEHGEVLLHNLRVLGRQPADIDHVCLSHGHFDHCGGLGALLVVAPHVSLWGAEGIATPRLSGKDPATARPDGGGPLLASAALHGIADAAEILPGVTAFCLPADARDPAFVCQDNLWEVSPSGAVLPDSFADDMSLLVNGERGVSLILGCAHAGLPHILRYASRRFGVRTLHAVVGGMHLAGLSPDRLPAYLDAFREFSVRCWRPSHCTGFAAAAGLAARFADVSWAGAGTEMIL